uniref:Uncharacterized protein n=1 Tax=Anguilla anguilla TaxID=7936 RepID=A0A0E9PJE4_ANGAN
MYFFWFALSGSFSALRLMTDSPSMHRDGTWGL